MIHTWILFVTVQAIGTGVLLLVGLCLYKVLYPDIFGLDRGLAATFFGALHGETISLIVAQWKVGMPPERYEAGCRWCAFLNVMVETNHCANQLNPDSPKTPIFNGIRAGLCLVALTFVLILIPATIGSAVLGLVSLF